MAQYTLNGNPISIQVDENTIARPVMRRAPSIQANSPTVQTGKPQQIVGAPSVKVLWSDGSPATSNEKYTIQVSFRVQSGNGSINVDKSEVVIEPDVNGIASLQSWILGPDATENIVVAAANIVGKGSTPEFMVGNGNQQLAGGPLTFRANSTANIISVTVLPNPGKIPVGGQIQLKAVALMEPGLPQPTWSWSTNNGTIITLAGNSDTALVTGLTTGTVQVTATARAGDAQKSGNATVEVTALPPDPEIGVTASPDTVTITNNGETKTSSIRISRIQYTGNVNLLLQGLPAGVTAIFSPSATTANDAILTLQASSTAVPGTYPLVVVADGTDVTDATTPMTLVVREADAAPVCVITEVTINPSIPISLQSGQSVTVTGTAFGTNCTSQQLAVKYISSNTDVATVTSGGQVVARNAGTASISAVSLTDGTKSASVTVIVSQQPPTPSPSPRVITSTWRSCDGETHQGNPPAGYVSATYTGAGNGICWEPSSVVGFEPDLNTALLFQYQRDSGNLPNAVTITARNPAQAVNYQLTLSTNDEIEITPKIFDLPAKGTKQFTVKVTKPLLDKLADGTSDIALNIEIKQI